ncbi:MAG TPA: crotonase/enoyl-CoA hydratase family protein [Casimicrobiaceae bacterium]|nr:crotonase/enoyl-CoA hydratase family protein [Casimicrobiaceae bacterium]
MSAIAAIHHLPQPRFTQLESRFDDEFGVYWAMMNPHGRPCFSPSLLIDLKGFIDSITRSNGEVTVNGGTGSVKYAVLASKIDGIFNLGGDLAMLRNAIVHGDRRQLEQYARMCVDDLFDWNRSFGLDVTTISLVQGNALGGGFEAALASEVVIAEESVKLGFPEVLFNLFPGMGAYSFLTRKVGRRITEELITSGNTYSAKQLYDMGVVDVVTPDGTGEAAVYGFVKKHRRGGNGRRAFARMRRDFEAVPRKELEDVTRAWVDSAVKLTERDLKTMDRLIRAQERAVVTEISAGIADKRASWGGAD